MPLITCEWVCVPVEKTISPPMLIENAIDRGRIARAAKKVRLIPTYVAMWGLIWYALKELVFQIGRASV